MTDGKSREKGKRGELDLTHRLAGSARRTGHAFVSKPDITTDFAIYSVKNKTLGGSAIYDELIKLQAQAPQHHHYVAFKPRRGKWIIAELLEQHHGDHGDVVVKEENNG